MGDVPALYSTLMELIVRLAAHGLIHCDYNQFNILLNDRGKPTLIDFPQMVSTSHINAQRYVYIIYTTSGEHSISIRMSLMSGVSVFQD